MELVEHEKRCVLLRGTVDLGMPCWILYGPQRKSVLLIRPRTGFGKIPLPPHPPKKTSPGNLTNFAMAASRAANCGDFESLAGERLGIFPGKL